VRRARAVGVALAVAAALVHGSVWARAGWGDDSGGPEDFKATVQLEGGRVPGTHQTQVTIHIETTTPLEGAKQLAALVSSGGQPALQAALDRYSNGVVSFGVLQYPLNVMVKKPNDRGQRYVIVANRPFSAYEVNTDMNSVNYAFGVVVFDVDDFGNGGGKVFERAQITVNDDGAVDVNGYGQPGRLLDVSRQ
jgi:hypothetical protein